MNGVREASTAQIRAAQPGRSAWVAANAGSGKTKVLTDRVARLLLRGTEPERVLCLTFTKAAASEMQNRLYQRLGAWAMLDDHALIAELAALGETVEPHDLQAARTLFASAVETPGGLKIQTIHAFCDRILRQFPLEAGVPAQFETLDDRAARQLHEDVLNDMVGQSDDALQILLRDIQSVDLSKTLKPLLDNPRAAEALAAQPERAAPDFIIIDDSDRALLGEILSLLPQGGSTDQKAESKLAALLTSAPGADQLDIAVSLFLGTIKGEAYQPNAFPTQKVLGKEDSRRDQLLDIKQSIAEVRDQYAAHLSAKRHHALGQFAISYLDALNTQKAQRGLLEFSDLIAKTRALLTRSEMADWVLYKLDGGIDHILVDEAQDTSQDQWDIVEALSSEFMSGESDPEKRSLFVVGDAKQSIYSFQGASPDAFAKMEGAFRTKLAAIDQALFTQGLSHSFRSSRAILNLVDAVASQHGAQTEHIPISTDLPGRVDLWPYRAREKDGDEEPWFNPVDMLAASDPRIGLAEDLADQIADLIQGDHAIADRDGARQIRAGDIMVLLQSRNVLFRALIPALQARGVPVAGADRLKISEDLAVKDILSLMKFIALDEDDLSLAEVLRSPLCGLSEADLFRLAHDRKGTLWEVLRNSEAHEDARTFLTDMRNRADFMRPYELIEHCLIQHRGRTKLMARLGKEVEDPLNELLAQALRFEQIAIPELTGFLEWFSSGEVEIKRDLDSAQDEIRVMTVHGAKGLEAPIVILPDTAPREGNQTDTIRRMPDGRLLWPTPKPFEDRSEIADKAVLNAREAEENLRLLYVALTRAERWLIVAGAGKARPKSSTTPYWYDLIESALGGLGCTELPDGKLRFEDPNWPKTGTADSPVEAPQVARPDYTQHPAPKPKRPIAPLNPSKLGGPKVLDGTLKDPDAASRGTALHRVLEALGKVDEKNWARTADAFLAGVDYAETVKTKALNLLAMDHLKPLLKDGLSEVSFSAVFEGAPVRGSFDLLIQDESGIHIVDYKSNALVPKTAAETPEGILRQMALYRDAARQIFPDQSIRVSILWTETGVLMKMPDTLLTDAFRNISVA
ncbi:MAG: double-strand break repair helicase AddA [Pseudomonadota bacterium]